MNTLFLYLHLLFIMLSIVNVICFMKLINKISSKQNEGAEENPPYHAHVSEKPKAKYVIVHKKESKYNKDTTEIMKDRIISIESEISDIKEQLDGKDSKSVVYDCTKKQ